MTKRHDFPGLIEGDFIVTPRLFFDELTSLCNLLNLSVIAPTYAYQGDQYPDSVWAGLLHVESKILGVVAEWCEEDGLYGITILAHTDMNVVSEMYNASNGSRAYNWQDVSNIVKDYFYDTSRD